MSAIHKRSELLILSLLLLSLILYGLEYFIFGQGKEIGIGFLGNLAFLPIYVLFVTMMIERVLKAREKEALHHKMNMVIGVFFSEVGTTLLRDGFRFLVVKEELARRVKITPDWGKSEFSELAAYLKKSELKIDSALYELQELKNYLVSRRGFMLGLLENPNLMEHDGFTDLLWGVFHLLEELEARQVLTSLPQSDMEHLSGDIQRAYTHLLQQWLFYLRHLKTDYPYLFSLAIRSNPLNPEARIEVG